MRHKLLAPMLLALGLFSFNAFAEEDTRPWWNISGISYHSHVKPGKEHNKYNYGVGYEWKGWYGMNWQVGSYHNSQWKPSHYIMAELTSWKISDRIRFRLNGGIITGYHERYPLPGVLPVWTYENGSWGVDVVTIPHIKKNQGIYAAQLKLRF
jgi:hypothetical protein